MISTDNFDSRALRYTDAYGQRFMRRGTYRYNLVTAGTGQMGEHPAYTINVEECDEDHKMKQYYVNVLHDDEGFKPDDPEITIQVGDLVLWSCRQPTAPPFEVVGDREFFGSAKLVNECGYAHAFGTPGEYHWTDANAGKLSGVVKVRNPKCESQKDLATWQKQLTKGALVLITDTIAEPAKIEIITGQTVYFAIVKCGGVSITDSRCVDASNAIRDDLEAHGYCEK